MTPPTVDVVVVTFNSADLVGTALTPLLGEFNVIVIDNDSTDESVDVAARLGADVVENPVNAGFGAAANIAIGRSGADFVLLLNPDASISADDVRTMVDRLDGDPGLAAVSPRVVQADGVEQRVTWPLPTSGKAWLTSIGLDRISARIGPWFLAGACLVIRREAFMEVDGFDERFWLYAEEADLIGRFQEAGWRTEVVETATAHHVGGASGDAARGLVLDHFERGAEHVVHKREGSRGVVSLRVATVVGSAIRSVVARDPQRRELHRDRLRRAARALVTDGGRVRLSSPATRAPGQGLVVCSLEPWDEVWRRNQFLVRELLALDPNRRVLFVEPPFDWVHEHRRSAGRRRRRGLRPVTDDGRIVRFEPGKVLPRLLGPFADRSLRRQVRRAAAQLGFVDPTLWINDSNYAGLARETGWPSLYDMTDDWTQAGGSGRETSRVTRNERRLFADCGAVVVCSEGLAASRRGARPDLRVVPNAVDVDAYRRRRPRPSDLPPGRTAVYVGTLHDDRVDVDLVDRAAGDNPDTTIVLVGPNALGSSSHERLRAHPNIVFLGPRTHDEIPGYLQHADLLIVPHRVSAFTESLDPIKAYEYAAVRTPVLSTPVAGFRGVRGFTIAARSEFSAAMAGPFAAVGTPMLASWGDRARAFDDALSDARRGAPRRTPAVGPGRIVLAPSAFAPHKGGVEELTRQLAHEYQEMGIETAVVTMRWPKSLPTAELIEGVPVYRFVFRSLDGSVRRHLTAMAIGPLTLVGLLRLLRRLKPDLVHIQCVSPGARYLVAAARILGIPLVVTVQGELSMDATGVYERSRFARHTLRVALRRADAVTACSAATLHEAEVWLGHDLGRRASVVHNGVRVTEFVDVEPYDAGRPYIFAIGRHVQQKGFDVLVDAFATLVSDGDTDHLLVLAGDGPERGALERRVRDHGVVDRVRFLGATDRSLTTSLFKGADLFVMPSRHEPFGIVNLEAMAAGVPVIATEVGGVSEFVVDEVSGLLVEAENPDALVAAMGRVLGDDLERKRLVESGTEVALSHDWTAIAKQYGDTYGRALG